MIVKHLDLRQPGELKKFIGNNEIILDVYFLIEETKSTHYHLTTIVIRTKKCLYISPRTFFSFESEGGGKSAIIEALKNIFEINSKFNSFYIWCAKNKDLDELEDETLIRYDKTHLPRIQCPVEYNVNIDDYAKKRFFEFKDIALQQIKNQ